MYIENYFNLKIKFPIIRLPKYLISTISIIDLDGGMCNSKGVEAEGTQTQDRNKLIIGVSCQSRDHRRRMATVNVCVKVRKGRTDVREKDWILHQPGLGDHQADQRRARGLRKPKVRDTGPCHTMSIAGYLRNRLL